jgi:hypothetical protein
MMVLLISTSNLSFCASSGYPTHRGNIDLTLYLPFLGGTQLEILCGVTSILLIITHAITVFNVKERILRSTDGYATPFKAINDQHR